MKLRKQIRGYEGLYEVRSDGAIISMPREKRLPNGKLCQSKERVMSPARIGEDGYEFVYLRKCGKTYRHYVHRLVAMAFIPNPDSKPQVNHIDGNPSNNCVNNLEWCTAKENQWHRRNILGKTSNGRETPVRCVELGRCFPTIQGAADWLGLQKSHICHCLKGDRNTTGGYHFEPCTKEEAEEVVEKLKAWKRLKDKGFEFKTWGWEKRSGKEFTIWFTIDDYENSTKDLDLLFGDEE